MCNAFYLASVSNLLCTLCRTKSFKAIELSLRIDAIASAGFKISRSKLVDLIRYGLHLYWTLPSIIGSIFDFIKLYWVS